MYRSYNIAAKVTNYNGTVFRSRLEARWAVYLDELGVCYEYEPEFFQLDSRNYLPDFWVKDDDSEEYLWLEIKPTYPTEIEIETMNELCNISHCPGMIIYGSIPHPEQHMEYGFCSTVGHIYFGSCWEKTEYGYRVWFDGWNTFDKSFPTFDRNFLHVDQALEAAIKFSF